MIWIASTPESSDREAFRRHLRGMLLPDARAVGEVEPFEQAAASLAAIWAIDFGQRPVPDGAMALLGARILWELHEAQAARRVVEQWAGPERAGDYLPVIRGGGLTLEAALVLGAGILRSEPTLLAPPGTSWRLAVQRLRCRSGQWTELMFQARVRRVIAPCAGIWDASDGRGLLVTRGLDPSLPIEAVGNVLASIGRHRGWAHTPNVLC